MSIRTAPCNWPAVWCDAEGVTTDTPNCGVLANMPASGADVWVGAATEFLWRWTGRRFGTCDVTVRPCRQDCMAGFSTFGRLPSPYPFSSGPWTPVMIGGSWYNLGCGTCLDDCSCSSTSSLLLPGPVDAVSAVVINGETLDPAAYRVDNAKALVRVDGGMWPICQDMGKPAGEDDTWSVTYSYGIPVPMGGQIAAGVLACELAKAACNDASCQLPKRWRSITREGVTIQALDTFDDLDQGHTGIWAIDSWVSSINYSPKGSRVRSPDYRGPRVRRTTWP